MQGGYIAKLAQLRPEAEAGRNGISPAPKITQYLRSILCNVSGGSLHVAGQIDRSHQRGAKMEQDGKSMPFRCKKTKRGLSLAHERMNR